MCITSYILILSLLSLFSQGLLLSVSKSLQEVEDEDMLLAALNLGKTLRNGDKTMNRGVIPLLKHYKTEDSTVFNEKNAGNTKFLDRGSRHDFFNHVMPNNLGRKQLPYPALKGAMAFPADTEIQNIESTQERETTDEENSAKFPIGRRDFDSKYILFLHKRLFHSGKLQCNVNIAI
ncbi:pro-MCH [Corvus moneduloides]|uniref:Pro-melanin concentrating hormone n=1 Tax=Corvus moneduloides TaxID=1196302 RepID=A0A8C3DED6_CORMO|nr:pro-MCH [Corvus moneduloides]